MKNTKKALLTSALALFLCFSMLVGTTFAWFTDAVTSKSNLIQAGKLDAEMYWSDTLLDADSDQWQSADGVPVFTYDKWEPGYTEIKYVKIANNGNLSFKWQLTIEAENTVGKLAEVIDVYYVNPVSGEITSLDGLTSAGVLVDVIGNRTATEGVLLPEGETSNEYLTGSTILAIAFHMQEDAGNDYQNESVGDGFSLKLLATQFSYENDAFGSDYDKNAVAAIFPGFQGGSAGISVTLDEQRYTTTEVVVECGDISAVIPAGVKLADGYNSLGLAVALKNASESNVQLSETEKMRPSDVHIEGVAADNTTPMFITLKHYLTTGLNSGALTLYHVENGVTVPMTYAATPANHNEFTYNPATGDVTLALASFSEVAVVADTNNPWNGETFDYSWYDASATVLTIYNADQLAGFGAIVDGKVEEIAQDSFAGKTVKLANNIYLSGELFDPIGWGYVNTGWNSGKVAGKVFMGTFDGDGKTIFDLYQSGWDLEEKTGTDYTYTNCGFGLFAAASNATFKNLTISGAYVRVECVEAGVLVGLSQNSCTYENIKILDSKIANYQRPAGGLIGEVSGEGTTTITNVTIGSDVVVGSLWGDFDAPVGGVIGAYWNDVNANPKIVMSYVDVGCRLDVYNDITSAYQWHAYRRAGMLIGNTDMTDPNNAHKAYAPFLTCTNVNIYYGDWVNYHYCQFTNQDNTWANNYPWVRVEAGENCSAYSNPRYGQPVVGGVTVSTDDHTCTDEHHMVRQFSQLYGGGQGVYGQDIHNGVYYPDKAYSITYVNDGKTLDIIYVTDNTKAVDVANDQAQKLVLEWAEDNITGSWEFGGWMNAGSTKIETIRANNTKDIVLYPYFNKPYTARFVDQQGNVIAWCLFHAEDLTKLDTTKAKAEAALPYPGEDLKFDYWEVHVTDNNGNITSKPKYSEATFDKYENDVTIYPVYLFKGDVNLVPVDTNSDGIIDHYQVAGYSNPNGQAMVEIPASVNGKPILQINQNAFSSYDGVHSIVVPNGVTIKKNAFTEGSRLGSGEEITIYFEGTKAQWNALTKDTGWDYGIGNNSRIFFLKDGKVDTTQGYLQVGSRKWNEKTDFASVKEQYSGYCDCKEGTGGDTGHIYVRVNTDGTETIMQHNANGTPVNEQGVEIYWGVIKEGWLGSIGEEKGLRDDDTNDTYKRYRPDAAYWEGVTIN